MADEVVANHEDIVENDPFAEGGALESAYFMLQEMKLPMPPLPQALLGTFHEVEEYVYTSAEGQTTLDTLDTVAEVAAQGDLAPYVALSYEGYGSQAWFLRYHLVTADLAVFVELPFGGAYSDVEVDRLEIEATFAGIQRLLELMDQADSESAYVVDHRGLQRGSRWCRVCEEGETPQWQEVAEAIPALIRHVRSQA